MEKNKLIDEMERNKLIDEMNKYVTRHNIELYYDDSISLEAIKKYHHILLVDKLYTESYTSDHKEYLHYGIKAEINKKYGIAFKFYNLASSFIGMSRIYTKLGKCQEMLNILKNNESIDASVALAQYYNKYEKDKVINAFKNVVNYRGNYFSNKIIKKCIPKNIALDILCNLDSNYDIYTKYRKIENYLNKIISIDHLRFIVLSYI